MPHQINNFFDFQTACMADMAKNDCPFEGNLKADGQLHRYSRDQKKNEKDEWYIVYHNATQSGDYWVCRYGTWSDGKATYTFKSWTRDTCPPHENQIRMQYFKEIIAKRNQEEDEYRAAQRVKCLDFWTNECYDYDPLSPHPYAVAKHITPTGAKISNYFGKTALTIPIHNVDRQLLGLQYIYNDNNKFEKRHFKGCSQQTGFFTFGDLGELTQKAFICEGYATGASIHQATHETTLVAFDCVNLGKVARIIKERYPHIQIIIAGDDDRNTPNNPGKTKALEISKTLNVSTIFPQFPDHPEYQTLTDFNDLHVTQGLTAVKIQLNQPTEKPRKKTFNYQQVSDMWNATEKKWDVTNWFGRGDKVMIFGAPGSGKSFVAIDLIVKCAQAKMFADTFIIPQPLNVAYCAGEGLNGITNRFKAQFVKHQIYDLPGFAFFPMVPQLFTGISDETNFVHFVQEVKEANLKIDVLVLDTLSCCNAGADENDAKDGKTIVNALNYISHHLGCTIILIHHTNKTGEIERGTSVLRAAMDCMVLVKHNFNGTESQYTMTCSKIKDGDFWEPKKFRLEKCATTNSATVEWIQEKAGQTHNFDDATKEILMEMNNYPGVNFKALQFVEVTGLPRQQVSDILTRLVKTGHVLRRLKDPTKDHGALNPWLYYVENSVFTIS